MTAEDPSQRKNHIYDVASHIEDELRKMRNPRWWLAFLKFLLPLGAAATYIYSMTWFYPERYQAIYGFMLLFFFPPLGKETVAIMAGSGFGTWESIILLASIDIFVAWFLVWNYDLVYHIPVLGKWLMRLEAKGRVGLRRRPWVRRTAFFGLTLVAIIPFQGTGAINGSIIGRMIGMNKWRAFGAIALGAYVGSALMAFFGSGIAAAFRTNLALGIVVLFIAVVAFVTGSLLWKRRQKNHKTNGHASYACDLACACESDCTEPPMDEYQRSMQRTLSRMRNRAQRANPNRFRGSSRDANDGK